MHLHRSDDYLFCSCGKGKEDADDINNACRTKVVRKSLHVLWS